MVRMSPAEADAYRRPCIDALGTQDAAEVAAREVDEWRLLLATAGADAAVRPAEQEWSVLDLLGHMADSELVNSGRYRWVLAENEPPLVGYDQKAWASRLDHRADDPEMLLVVFEALRRANVALWRRTPLADRDRCGIHAERGVESFELLFRVQAGHGLLHRAQGARALEVVRGRTGR
jgi:hypothetical protein